MAKQEKLKKVLKAIEPIKVGPSDPNMRKKSDQELDEEKWNEFMKNPSVPHEETTEQQLKRLEKLRKFLGGG